MSTDALDAWGWRIPFLLGLVVGIAGFILRRHVIDSVSPARPERSPFVETLLHHWRLVLWLAALTVFNSVSFYVMFVYVASWLQTADGIAPAHALEINTISMLILLPVLVLSGWLSDRHGRKPILLISLLLAVTLAVPLFWMMYHHSASLVLLGQMGFGVLIGLYGGTQTTAMVEAAPMHLRCTAVALGYNVCVGTIGGLTPLVATWLVDRTADQLAPAYLMMAAAAVSLVAIRPMTETYRTPIACVACGAPALTRPYRWRRTPDGAPR
jgi:MHS family proline/betaine transporter-like MFS transporter